MASDPINLSHDPAREAVARAFGADNRARLLDRYFLRGGAANSLNAWQHVYHLLLWIDRTTALAHCYESDKAQPGRPWYARSLRFHAWVSRELGVSPSELGEHIDWLFREAIKDLASTALASRSEAYREQRMPYEGLGFPEPGEDPELVGIIKETLGSSLASDVAENSFHELTRRIYAYMTQENKRRNLVGEGFEDVIGALISRMAGSTGLQVHNRVLLHELPGFHAPSRTEKAKKVDVALIKTGRRTLVSAKWSIRADREEQFQSDFETYARLEAAGEDFHYALVTNEFDAARLRAACERRRQNAPLFSHVVHINPAGVLAAYDGTDRTTILAVREHISSGRLMSLSTWLQLILS